MKTYIYIYSVTCINEGKLEYGGVSHVFTDRDLANKFVSREIHTQASLWKSVPTIFNKTKGTFTQIELKHPAGNIIHYYTLQAKEL